jgi:DNA replication protein DnaC
MTASAPAAKPAPPQVLLAHHLRQLKLPTFLREYEKLAAEAAPEGLDHVRFLLRLAELELIDRERRMGERRIRAAHFSAVKVSTRSTSPPFHRSTNHSFSNSRAANMSSPATTSLSAP